MKTIVVSNIEVDSSSLSYPDYNPHALVWGFIICMLLILEKLVWEMSCVKIGEMYGVSDNAVNKWCKYYGIKKPGRGDWEKIKSGKLEIPKQ